jgi:choice-of-anchor A domain-containing protein
MSQFHLAVIGLLVAVASISQASASTFVISGDATNFAVLYEGTGGHQLQTNNSNITGNIGIGGTGRFAPAGGCVGNCVITGTVEFSAANTGQYGTNAGTTVTGGATFNNANVQTDLNNLNSLSTTLGGTAGTSLAINTGGSGGSQIINSSSGTLDAFGNRVFTITSLQFNNATTLNIVGDAAGDSVVFNIASNAQFGGTISLSGLTADQVLFNITGTGHALQLTTNGAVLAGDFLDPLGTISANHAVIDGRIFGGDSVNLGIVSGVTLNAPVAAVPEPSTWAMMILGFAGVGFMAYRRKSKPALMAA